ncbi:hypothetical protein [Plasmodium yoelii yoelii]|uniref:Uncharacterized protein n=1 Tax=Plasmodium yoelii yoelii TaxID=73239 RepID=Q7RBS6_PLAYO|nr:hypothetical protein [Plasmodium yoelii yoelii]
MLYMYSYNIFILFLYNFYIVFMLWVWIFFVDPIFGLKICFKFGFFMISIQSKYVREKVRMKMSIKRNKVIYFDKLYDLDFVLV